MNKRFIGLALAACMSLGAFALTACKEGPAGGGNGGNAGNQSGSSSGGGETVKPGTVITDEATKKAILDAFSEATVGGFTYSASLDLSLTQGDEREGQSVSLEGAVAADEGVECDAYLVTEAGSGEQTERQYILAFLRKDGFYAAGGEAEEEVDFNVLKEKLKAEDDPIVLEKAETGALQTIAGAPAVVRLLKNAVSLEEGVITKTEGGYSLAFDLFGGIGALLEKAETLAGVLDTTADMTLTALFTQKPVDDLFTKLLNGITAKELYDLAGPFLPQTVKEALPEATAQGSAKDYVYGLLRSGSFYTAVMGEDEPWTQWQTLGTVPVSAVAEAIAGVPLEELGLKEMLSELRSGLEDKTVSLLADALFGGGAAEKGHVELSMSFSFDDRKRLLGFSLDALAEGTLKEEQQEGGPQSTMPQDGARSTAAATESGKGLRASLKAEATCAQSPALFPLAGCRYYGDGGDPVLIQ